MAASTRAAEAALSDGGPVLDQFPRDDVSLDLIGAFVDLRDLRIPIEPLDFESLNVT